MDATALIRDLSPILVPILTLILHKIGTKINANWPNYLKPFKAIIIGWIMTDIYKKTGVHLPTDLTAVTDQNTSAILMSGTVLGLVGIGLREAYQTGLILHAKFLAWLRGRLGTPPIPPSAPSSQPKAG